MNLERMFKSELARSRLRPSPAMGVPIGDDTLAALPEPARRYCGFMGVRGHAPIATFRAGWRGTFRQAPDADCRSCR